LILGVARLELVVREGLELEGFVLGIGRLELAMIVIDSYL